MIDFVKNKKLLEEEKKKFQSFEYYENLEKLLNEKENDPELGEYIKEYREVEAWLTRYDIKERNTTPPCKTEEEAKIALGKMLRDTEAEFDRLIDLEDKILELHYRQILRQEN